MLTSPVPIYLGCAALIVGSLGLGANHMLGNDSRSSQNAVVEPPLFAKSVEQASLPTTEWPSKNVDVAYYGPMVELLTQPTSSTPAPLADPSTAAAHAPEQRAAPSAAAPREAARREVVRDLAPPPSIQAKRAKNQRQRDDVRSASVDAATAEQADPRDIRVQETRIPERQRTATQAETERRDGRRSERRDRDEAEDVDARSRSDRRGRESEDRRSRDGERRVVVREEIREPEQRFMRAPEQREPGFSPFRLFGIFDQR